MTLKNFNDYHFSPILFLVVYVLVSSNKYFFGNSIVERWYMLLEPNRKQYGVDHDFIKSYIPGALRIFRELCLGTRWQDQFQVTGLGIGLRWWFCSWWIARTLNAILEYLWVMSMAVFSYYFTSFQNICIVSKCQETKNTKCPVLKRREIIVSHNKQIYG